MNDIPGHRRLSPLSIVAIALIGTMLLGVYILRNQESDLNGVWKLVWTQTDGQPRRVERELWAIRKGELLILRNKQLRQAEIRVDRNDRPFLIDLLETPNSKGIFQIEGGVLRVAWAAPGEARPTSFESHQGELHTVSELTRLNLDARMSAAALHEQLNTEFGPPVEYLEHVEFDAEAQQRMQRLAKTLEQQEAPLTDKEQSVLMVVNMVRDVEQGGFYRFFSGPLGGQTESLIRVLRQIGAPESASLIESACKPFPAGMPANDLDDRLSQLNAFELKELETLRDLQERFYSRREDLNLLLEAHLRPSD